AAPKMLADGEDEHLPALEAHNDSHALDLSEIRAGVEATLNTVSAQVASLEAALNNAAARDSRATRAAQGLRRRQLRRLRQLHPGAQRHLHEVQHLRVHQRLQLRREQIPPMAVF